MNEQQLRIKLDRGEYERSDEYLIVHQGNYKPGLLAVEVITSKAGSTDPRRFSKHLAVAAWGKVKLISGVYDLTAEQVAA